MFLLITLYLLTCSILACIFRLIIGPTIWDRLLALNLISIKTIILLSIYGVYTNQLFLIDIALSYGIIGFLTITLLSKFIVMGGRQK